MNDISAISDYALSLASVKNDRGDYVVTSQRSALFTAQLLLVADHIAGYSGYSGRYKALVANATGSMYVALTGTGYDYVKNYIDKQQVYEFRGYIGLYNHEPEIVMQNADKPVLKGEKDTLPYSLAGLTDEIESLSILNGEISNIKTNAKGIGYSAHPVSLRMKYLEKIENTTALFTDGQNVIQVHGHDKSQNGLSKNAVYAVTGIYGIYQYRIQLKLISYGPSASSIDFAYEDHTASRMTASSLYSYKYEIENQSAAVMSKNASYTGLFDDVYYFEGYPNFYTKDGKDYIVLDDSAKNPYTTQENAYGAKALFVNNGNCQALTDANQMYCPFLPNADMTPETRSIEKLYFIPYMYNTNGYWQVHVLSIIDY